MIATWLHDYAEAQDPSPEDKRRVADWMPAQLAHRVENIGAQPQPFADRRRGSHQRERRQATDVIALGDEVKAELLVATDALTQLR